MCHHNNERLLYPILVSLSEIVDQPCILGTVFGIVMLENREEKSNTRACSQNMHSILELKELSGDEINFVRNRCLNTYVGIRTDIKFSRLNT